MRRIQLKEFLTFLIFGILSASLSLMATSYICHSLTDEDLSFNLLCVTIFSILFYISVTIFYRFFLHLQPLRSGEIENNSEEQFIYHVYILFYLFYFYPFLFSGIVPVPFRRLMYKLLGASIDFNTYPSGIIFDPVFVSIGKNGIIGANSKLIPHVLEGNRLAHYPIHLGDNVTIGVNSTILAGTTIGDNAIVAAHSLVAKNTIINEGELWAGVPAKKVIKDF